MKPAESTHVGMEPFTCVRAGRIVNILRICEDQGVRMMIKAQDLRKYFSYDRNGAL